MIDRLRFQPALLKLDLYCRGARLDESCFIEGDGGRKILRTRAGLGSGLEVILPGDRSHPEMWTNVPVSEPFAARSPYTIHRVPGADEGVAICFAATDRTSPRFDSRRGLPGMTGKRRAARR